MSTNTRDIADRTGAYIGAVAGCGLVATINLDLSKFNLGGENFELNSTVGKIIVPAIVIGMCANAGRNAAVGVHDTVKYTFQVVKATAQKTKKLCIAAHGFFKTCCSNKKAASETTALTEVLTSSAGGEKSFIKISEPNLQYI